MVMLGLHLMPTIIIIPCRLDETQIPKTRAQTCPVWGGVSICWGNAAVDSQQPCPHPYLVSYVVSHVKVRIGHGGGWRGKRGKDTMMEQLLFGCKISAFVNGVCAQPINVCNPVTPHKYKHTQIFSVQ